MRGYLTCHMTCFDFRAFSFFAELMLESSAGLLCRRGCIQHALSAISSDIASMPAYLAHHTMSQPSGCMLAISH